jgi:hypothetical protein
VVIGTPEEFRVTTATVPISRTPNLCELELFRVSFSHLSAAFYEFPVALPGLGKPTDLPAGTGRLPEREEVYVRQDGGGHWGKVGFGKRGGECAA